MKLTLDVNMIPLSLNVMLGSKHGLSSGTKKKYFSALAISLYRAGIIKAEDGRYNKSKTPLLINCKILSGNAFWFEKISNNRTTKKPYVSARYLKLNQPLFIKPEITWQLIFETRRSRDFKNYAGGLKWLEDCMVSMNILNGDSIDDFKKENYPKPIIDKSKPSHIQVVIEEKENENLF